MFDFIYNGNIIGKSRAIPIVGDTYEDHIVWYVDYHLRVAYLTD